MNNSSFGIGRITGNRKQKTVLAAVLLLVLLLVVVVVVVVVVELVEELVLELVIELVVELKGQSTIRRKRTILKASW